VHGAREGGPCLRERARATCKILVDERPGERLELIAFYRKRSCAIDGVYGGGHRCAGYDEERVREWRGVEPRSRHLFDIVPEMREQRERIVVRA
jgi:hypothetical protein